MAVEEEKVHQTIRINPNDPTPVPLPLKGRGCKGRG
jgi:hypothetical protein